MRRRILQNYLLALFFLLSLLVTAGLFGCATDKSKGSATMMRVIGW